MSTELERARREIAEEMHELYEHFAAENGWETNSECHVSFDFLPAANQHVILRMADYVLERERLVREDERRTKEERLNRANERRFKVFVVHAYENLETRLNELQEAGYDIVHLLINSRCEYTIVTRWRNVDCQLLERAGVDGHE